MSPPTLTLPPGALQRVGDCIAQRAGLKPPTWVLESRLRERIAALGLDRAAAYVDLVTSPAGGKELDLLLEVLRVGETAFFRHRSHIKALTEVVVPALAESRGAPGGPRKVRAWSAGCATGEEAYTLAMILHRLLPRPIEVEVLATDLSNEALEVARAGRYPARALSPVPAVWRRWGFVADPEHDDTFRIAEPVAARVRFERRNLADPVYPRNYDLIWCRNVLIYFTPESRTRTVDRLVASLAPGGFLFVGYAESLRDFASVDAIRTPDAVLYRKAPRRHAALTPPGGGFPNGDVGSTPHRIPPEPAEVTTEELFVKLRGRYGDDDRLAEELAPTITGDHTRVVIDFDGAEYLSDGGAAIVRRARSAARAAGIEFELVAERPGPRRWLRRAGLTGNDAGEDHR